MVGVHLRTLRRIPDGSVLHEPGAIDYLDDFIANSAKYFRILLRATISIIVAFLSGPPTSAAVAKCALTRLLFCDPAIMKLLPND
jgi:hypothetical protein